MHGAGPERPADLELVRIAIVPDGAFGVLLAEGLPTLPTGLVSLERTYPLCPEVPRGPQLVKVPPGRYVCYRNTYRAGGYETYEISGVPGHSHILFHKGNVEDDSEGCILLGQRFGLVRGCPGVLESAIAHGVFMRLMHDRSSFDLRVRAVT